MPRELPWESAGSASKSRFSAPNGATPVSKYRNGLNSETSAGKSVNVNGKRNDTTPSKDGNASYYSRTRKQTPPSSPPLAALDDDYMREGYDADDIWIMVEDEFIATAKLFTRHVHHAAYANWKTRQSADDESLLSNTLERPIDGTTPSNDTMRLKSKASEPRAAIELHNKDVGSDAEQEPDSILPNLATFSQHGTQDLSGLGIARPRTRAAAGYAQSPKKTWRVWKADDTQALNCDYQVSPPHSSDGMENSSAEEDLDRSHLHKTRTLSIGSKYLGRGREKPEAALNLPQRSPGSSTQADVIPDTYRKSPIKHRRPSSPTPAATSSMIFGESKGNDTVSGFLARQEARRQRRRLEDERRAVEKEVDVPTWLI